MRPNDKSVILTTLTCNNHTNFAPHSTSTTTNHHKTNNKNDEDDEKKNPTSSDCLQLRKEEQNIISLRLHPKLAAKKTQDLQRRRLFLSFFKGLLFCCGHWCYVFFYVKTLIGNIRI